MKRAPRTLVILIPPDPEPRPEAARLFRAMAVLPDRRRRLLIDHTIGRYLAWSRWSVLDEEARRAVGDPREVARLQASLWSRRGCLYFLAAHHEQAGRLDWKAPGTRTLTAVNSPGFLADRGWAGNGADAYLAVGAPPSSFPGFALNSAHFGWWGLGTNTNMVGTSATGTDEFRAGSTSAPALRFTINDATTDDVSVPTRNNVDFCVVRAQSTAKRCYSQGTFRGQATRNSTAIATVNVRLLKTGASFTSSRMALFFAGGALDDAEVLAAHEIDHDYLAELGAVA